MSTLMEDRLAAALRAKADQVQPEDLRPLDVPVTPLRRRPRAPWVLGLAAAACAAAVAAPFVVGDDVSREPAPSEPSVPTDPTEVPEAAVVLRADVDGDGERDAVRIVREEGDAEYEVVVELASGDTVVNTGRTEILPEVVAGDLDRDGAADLVVRVSEDRSVMPDVYTWLDREGLVRAPWPAEEVAGWMPTGRDNRWSVADGRLQSWERPGIGYPDVARVPFWTWSLDADRRLVPGPMRTRCIPEGAALPVACEDPAPTSPEASPRGDLPALMPAVEETLTTEPYAYGADFFGPGNDDYAQLQGDLGEEGGAVAEGQVELVVTVDGVEHRAPVPAGQSPELVPQTLTVHGDTPVLLVRQSGGDLAVTTVYGFRHGELLQIPDEGEVPLLSGFVDHDGELTEQRTWVTTGGQLFSAVLLDHESRRHLLWHWDNLGETIAPTDLGEACIDWESGDYGRCR